MKSNKLLLALALVVATPAIVVPTTLTVEAREIMDFKDVSKRNPNYEIIMEMVEKGIINGYDDGTFRPSEPITRKHASALLNRQLKLPEVVLATKMKDLPKASPYYDVVSKVVYKGYLKVNPNGLIFPDRALTRGEMAQVLARAYQLDLKSKMHPFTDVREWNNMYVSALYNSSITTGYVDGTFREDEVVTREHFAVFMYRTMKYVEPQDLNTLTDEQIFSMSNIQLANYLEPLKYYLHKYLPDGQKETSDNYRRLERHFTYYTTDYAYPYYIESINWFNKEGIERNRLENLGKFIEDLSNNVFGTSAKETIKIINDAFLYGKFIRSDDIPTAKKDFAFFYNYGAGNIIMKVDNKKTPEINKFVQKRDWDALTESDILNMGDTELALYVKPLQYKSGEYNTEVYKPKGVTDIKALLDKNKEEYIRLANELGVELFSFSSGSEFAKEYLKYDKQDKVSKQIKNIFAPAFGLTTKETIEVINKVFEEGIVISSRDNSNAKNPYVMYYDYEIGKIIFEEQWEGK